MPSSNVNSKRHNKDKTSNNNIDLNKAPTKNDRNESLPESDDPFAHRQGKTLIWRNVNMNLVSYLVDSGKSYKMKNITYLFPFSSRQLAMERKTRNSFNKFGVKFPSAKQPQSWAPVELERPVY